MDPNLQALLAVTVVVYALLMLAVSWWSRGKVNTTEDFLVAGRRLPLMLAFPTLLATWFGAGVLLTATDEVRAGGLRAAALEPIGAGLCLILAGWWLAGPLWKMKLLTLSDFFAQRYGVRAERWSAILMVPSYFGWIAAQYIALASMLEILFGISLTLALILVATVGILYTLFGGMWSVTLTEAGQIALVVIGVLVMAWNIFTTLGEGSLGRGIATLWTSMPAEKKILIPRENAEELVGWLGVLTVGALGNLPSQDLAQRIFASRSVRIAKWACYLAGITYLTFGVVPLAIGLAADLLIPGAPEQSTLTTLAHYFLSPALAVLFTLVVMSAVLATIDSSILSPACVLAQNLLWPLASAWFERRGLSLLLVNRLCVIFIGLASLFTAFLGENAYSLLEDGYAAGLVSLLVPLLIGLYSQRGDERAALASMVVGSGVWLIHLGFGAEQFMGRWWPTGWIALPVALTCAGLGAVAYAIASLRRSSGEGEVVEAR
ncbi:sodium:solute symporter family protein [Nannocystaceae bacterium ST9]